MFSGDSVGTDEEVTRSLSSSLQTQDIIADLIRQEITKKVSTYRSKLYIDLYQNLALFASHLLTFPTKTYIKYVKRKYFIVETYSQKIFFKQPFKRYKLHFHKL